VGRFPATHTLSGRATRDIINLTLNKRPGEIQNCPYNIVSTAAFRHLSTLGSRRRMRPWILQATVRWNEVVERQLPSSCRYGMCAQFQNMFAQTDLDIRRRFSEAVDSVTRPGLRRHHPTPEEPSHVWFSKTCFCSLPRSNLLVGLALGR
jgi:hypothetical protein